MPDRYNSLQNWLTEILGTSVFNLKPASEDASFRTYHRLFLKNKTFIVMDAPPEQENCKAFIKITKKLRACDVNVPIIHNVNIEQGFLLLSDLGNDLYLNKLNKSSIYELYSDALSTLVSIQVLVNVGGVDEYDKSLLISEMNLFREWLIEKHLNIKLSDSQVKILTTLFDLLVNNALQQPKVFVHRDFHSRNLMVTKENNPGVIDYQDAVYGPISYDLVSILKDCYIKWPKEEIDKWIDFYLNKLYEEKAQYRINRDEFIRWFDLMGVQRHLKASGIFMRLSHRDGKHNFLKDIPRTLSYILDLKETYEELQPICIILEELVLPRLKENE
jgi:aminoglycoside/choline kinase family phosphotransferase